MNLAKIQITDLQLRTVIGANDWERTIKQDVLINITIGYDASKAIQSDSIKDTVDYKTITKKIIKAVEASEFHLLEKLAQMILDIVMEVPTVCQATVCVDKPGALRFAKSVSVQLSSEK